MFELYSFGDKWKFQKEAIRTVIKYYISKVSRKFKAICWKDPMRTMKRMKDFGDESFLVRTSHFQINFHALLVSLLTGTGKT